MKFRFRIFSVMLVILLSVSVIFNVTLVMSAGTAEPGSAEDPIISKSYVDARFTQLESQFKALQSKYDAALKELQTGGSSQGFAVVELQKGKTIISGDGAEIILRSGTATAIKGTYGSLADTTSAKDLAAGAAVTKNHLLISSRNDGRGLKATAMCYLLVRGGYTIPGSTTTTTTPIPTVSPAANTATPSPTASPTASPTTDTGTDTPIDTGTGDTEDIPSTAVTGTVIASALNVRAESNTNCAILGKIYNGEVVTILSQENEWYRIKTQGGITGWVLAEFLDVE